MKFLCMLFYVITTDNHTSEISALRTMYNEAVFKSDKAEALISYTEKNISNPLHMGYSGAANMLLAKHAVNPFVKYRHFNKGKNLLQEAIIKDSLNCELRYLRFCIQNSVPAFLGYNRHIYIDKVFLINAVNDIADKELKAAVLSALKNSSSVSLTEKDNLPNE